MATARTGAQLSLFPSENDYRRRPSLRQKRSRSPLPNDSPIEQTKSSTNNEFQTTVIQVHPEQPNGLYQYPAVPKRTSTPVAMAPLPSPRLREEHPMEKRHFSDLHSAQPLSGYSSRPGSGLYDMASPASSLPQRAISPSPTDTNTSSYIPHSSPATSHSTPPMAAPPPKSALPKPPPGQPPLQIPQQRNLRALQNLPLQQDLSVSPPSPPPSGPAPVPITSIFPQYNPNISLQKQHYAPAFNPLAANPPTSSTTATATAAAAQQPPPPREAISRTPYSPDIARACSPPLLGGFVSHDKDNADDTTSRPPNRETTKGRASPKKEKSDPFSSSSTRTGVSARREGFGADENPRDGPHFPPPPTKEIKTSARARAREQTGGKLAKKRSQEAGAPKSGASMAADKNESRMPPPRTNRWAAGAEEKDTFSSNGQGSKMVKRADQGGFAKFLKALKRLLGIGWGK